jgi:hypothetical protein
MTLKCILALLCGLLLSNCSQTIQKKEILSNHLQNSYSTKNWYVPLKIAIQDLNIEQVNWKDSSGNQF